MHPGHCNGNTGETHCLKSWWDEERKLGKEGRIEVGGIDEEKEKQGEFFLICEICWRREKGWEEEQKDTEIKCGQNR